MRVKSLLVIVILSIIIGLSITIPSLAAGEQGTGTLYVYADSKMTILVLTDSYGRYYVVPGQEYYFKITGIEEYTVGEKITIWAFRVNTEEDVFIKDVTVDSQLSAVFRWTIPDEWLDEVVKIKYGTNLESNWFYAIKEIWANARVGTGVLKVYTDPGRTLEAPLGPQDNYLVYPSATYYFTIDGISEYPTGYISVWAFYRVRCMISGTYTTYNISVAEKKLQPTVEFEWTIPSDIPIETSIKFKYGTNYIGPRPVWYYASRDTISAPRLLLVIPGVFLGSIGAITALFSALGLKAFLIRRH